MSPIDHSLLEKDLAVIRKNRGESAILRGDEQDPVKRIEVDSPAIMRITGGGIPLGRVSRFWGKRSSGKSHVAWMVVRAAQHAGLLAAYWNAEKQYDEIHCRENLGINTKELFIGQTTVIEEIGREMDLLLRSIDLHVVDSTSFATSADELAEDTGDWQRALDARVWKKVIKRINNRMDKDDNAIILIDHAGTDQKTKVEYPKGGDSLDYASSMNLHFKLGSWLFYDPHDGYLEKEDKIKEKDSTLSYAGLKDPDGQEITVRCEKSRVCRPFRVAKMRLDLHTFQFDTIFELLDAATFFDEDGLPAHRSEKTSIIQQTGAKSSWYALPDGRKVQGSRGIREELESNAELTALVRKAMLAGY